MLIVQISSHGTAAWGLVRLKNVLQMRNLYTQCLHLRLGKSNEKIDAFWVRHILGVSKITPSSSSNVVASILGGHLIRETQNRSIEPQNVFPPHIHDEETYPTTLGTCAFPTSLVHTHFSLSQLLAIKGANLDWPRELSFCGKRISTREEKALEKHDQVSRSKRGSVNLEALASGEVRIQFQHLIGLFAPHVTGGK